MIYILAPFNLHINTTSRNRILSFYKAIKAHGLDVTFINPPLIGRDREIYLNGLLNDNSIDKDSLVNIPLQESVPDRIVSALVKKPNYKTAFALLNLSYLILSGKDFNYPSQSLNSYFKTTPLNTEDVLLASAPPSTLLVDARKIAKKAGCKLILDYRDPWTYGYKPIDSMPLINDLKKYKSRAEENKCLEYATLVNCDSASVKKLFPRKFHHKINPILNGANLQAIDLNRIEERNPSFRIVYLGTIYNDQLIDESFFTVVKGFINQKQINKGQFELVFIGSAKNQRLRHIISAHQLNDFALITERVEISKAMEIAYTASAFLHLKYGSRAEVDTSKHLDYLALQKPILLPVTDNGNVASLIKKDNAGYVAESTEQCFAVIEELWNKHQRGESMKTPRSPEFLYSISREAEANKLVDLIKKHCLG